MQRGAMPWSTSLRTYCCCSSSSLPRTAVIRALLRSKVIPKNSLIASYQAGIVNHFAFRVRVAPRAFFLSLSRSRERRPQQQRRSSCGHPLHTKARYTAPHSSSPRTYAYLGCIFLESASCSVTISCCALSAFVVYLMASSTSHCLAGSDVNISMTPPALSSSPVSPIALSGVWGYSVSLCCAAVAQCKEH